MNPEFADRVLQAAVQAGNDPKNLQSHLDSLDASGQEQFINEAASHLGVSQNQSPSGTYDPSTAESFALGAGNITGLERTLAPVGAAIEKGVGTIHDMFRPEGERIYDGKSISDLSDETRNMITSAKTNHPIASAAGQGLGTALALAPFGAAGTAPLVQGTVAGGQELLDTHDPLRAAGVGLLAAATSGILSKFLPAAGKATSGAAETFDEAATATARRTLGYRTGSIRAAGGVERVNDLVKTLRDNGLFANGISKDAMAKTVDDLAVTAGQNIDTIYSQSAVGQAMATTGDELAMSLKGTLGKEIARVKAIAPEKAQQLDAVIAMINQHSGGGSAMTFGELWQLTKDLGSVAWEKGVANESRQVFQDSWKILKDATQNALEFMAKKNPANAEILTDLASSNKLYTSAIEGGKMLSETANREAGTNIVGLRHLVSGGAGGILGPMGPPLVAAGHIAADKFGMQIASKTLEKGSEALALPVIHQLLQTPKVLGEFAQPLLNAANRGGVSLGAAHYMLSQTNEKYRTLINKLTTKKEGK